MAMNYKPSPLQMKIGELRCVNTTVFCFFSQNTHCSGSIMRKSLVNFTLTFKPIFHSMLYKIELSTYLVYLMWHSVAKSFIPLGTVNAHCCKMD